MSAEIAAVALLNERFLLDYPAEAARALEPMSADAMLGVLQPRSPEAQLRGWQALAPDAAAEILASLPEADARRLLVAADPQVAVAALAHLDAARRESLLGTLPPDVSAELHELLQYGEDTAGSLMDTRVGTLVSALTVAEAIERLRGLQQRGLRELFVVDEQMQLKGQMDVHDLLLSSRDRSIGDFTRAVSAVVCDVDPVSKVEEALRQQPLDALPVVSTSGRLKGVIRLPELMATVRRQSRWWKPAWRARGVR